jgi:hypothetical protein
MGGTSAESGSVDSTGGTDSGNSSSTSSSTGGTTAAYDCAKVLPFVIDDMEDGDSAIYPCYGRMGDWYTFVSENDWVSELQPAPHSLFTMTRIARPSSSTGLVSSYAAMVEGKTTEKGDCGMGVLLNTASTESPVYDMSGFGSIRFWYRTEGLASSSIALRIQLLLSSTVAIANGGACKATAVVGDECNDHYSYIVPPSSVWTEAKVLLSYSGGGQAVGFAQETHWGRDVRLDLTKVMGVQFVVKQGQNSPFKIYVDDLVLAKPGL